MASRCAKRWDVTIPLTGRAMAKAANTVYIAGTPVALGNEVAGYVDAYAGRSGGVLWAASAEDGQKIAECELVSAPVWDSLAVADSRLYLALEDGSIVCFGE